MVVTEYGWEVRDTRVAVVASSPQLSPSSAFLSLELGEVASGLSVAPLFSPGKYYFFRYIKLPLKVNSLI